MAFDAFLKIDGIAGESTDSVHKGEIELMSFSWGETQAGGPGNGRGPGAAAGRVSFQDVHFSKPMDSASPLLFQACASGKHLATATLSVRKAGGDQVPAVQNDFLKINLQNVLVSSYQTGGGLQDDGTYSPLGNADEDVPSDQFSISFQKIEFQFVSQKTGATADQSFDLGG